MDKINHNIVSELNNYDIEIVINKDSSFMTFTPISVNYYLVVYFYCDIKTWMPIRSLPNFVI